MRKRTFTLGFLCFSILISGCTPQQSVKNVEKKEAAHRPDRRNLDAAATEHDPELYIGDLGVEQFLSRHRVNSFQTAALLDPNGFPLVQRFPSKSIAPIRGSYVENIITTAKSYLGTPYVYGSDRTEPSTFDCSDFTRWVFLSALGMDLPWDSRSQAAYVKAFSKKKYTDVRKARRGDLLFFTHYRGNKASDYKGLKASEKPVSHLGIYLGNGKIIHTASKETGGVRIDSIGWKHLKYRFVFGGGVLD